MGQPVVHFEVMGDDGDKLRSFYSDLFDWKINADNPMKGPDEVREGVEIGLFTDPDGLLVGIIKATS